MRRVRDIPDKSRNTSLVTSAPMASRSVCSTCGQIIARFSGTIHDRVFVAASVHAERHEPEMVAFVKAHRQDLERLSAAFLSVNLFEAVAEDPAASPEHRAQAAADAQQMCDLFVRETGWHPAHILLVAGALAYRRYNLIVRVVMQRIARKAGIPTDAKRDYDFTNWAAVDHFVRRVTDATRARSAVS